MRSSHIARLLPAFEYEPIVVTGPERDTGFRWTPRDETLADEPGARVHRVGSPEPSRGGKWGPRAARWLRVHTQWERWWTSGVLSVALDIGQDAELVHASVAPYETARGALEVASALRIPLVLDFEDPWAFDEMLVYPTVAHRALELRMMRKTLGAADAIVMNTHEATRRVVASFPELQSRPVVCVPNGFDADDFSGPAPLREDQKFRIVHTGSLHTELGLEQRTASRARRAFGGTVEGVDFLTRSHVFLLRALEGLVRERQDIARVP